MCGILAFFSSKEPISSELLQNANRTLKHRGPDNQSFWLDPNGLAGLGHARLSLLDLSPQGDQPFTWKTNGNSDTAKRENLKLVHNGEFYDFERIKEELQARGHRFKTRSDSEILLPLYEEFGTAALSHLRGEFAFVLWDRDNRSVFAARDRFGIKPLYYSVHAGNLYFASEIKALFALGVPAEWDRESVYQFQSTWILPRQRTLYKNIFQVPPGHFLVATADSGFSQPQLIPYWDFDYPVASETENRKFDLEEEVLKFRELLQESIKLRLRADVPVACYLSGGLDSCSILGMAAQQSSVPIHAFTLSFVDQKEYDESDVAREMAKFTKSTYHEIPIRWQDLSDHFSDALWHSETPFINTHGVAKYLLSEAVRKEGIKAVLTGEGSDEILAGYAHFRKDLLMQRTQGAETDAQLAHLAETNAVSRGLLLVKETPAALAGLKRHLGYVPGFLEAHGLGAQGSMNLLQNEYKESFAHRDSWKVWLNEIDVSRQLKGRSVLNQSLYLWSKTMLPSYLLTVLGDRMEMAHSVEGRVPFLDHKLVEHVVRLPIELKINKNLTEKFLLREAARPFVTDTIYNRQKHPFLAPPSATSPGSSLFKFANDIFRSKSFAENPFYDQGKVLHLLDQVSKMSKEEQSSVDGLIMATLSMAVLQDKMKLS
jgi:asparagine synthase (glutamine-hydrolysing)